MKTIAWLVALAGLVMAVLVPRGIAIAVAVVAALAWGYLFTSDLLEHRQ